MKAANTLSRFITEYWSYYRQLEKDLIDTFRYVEPVQENRKTYSRQYQTLLNSIGSEVDVVGKSIAEYYHPDDKSLSGAHISHWGYIVQQNLPNIEGARIAMQGKIVMQPWKGWADEPYTTKNGITRYRLAHKKTNPEWWLAYNSTKHRRKSLIHPSESSYQRANLGNTLSALAGLHVLEKLFLAQIGPSENQLVETSELFEFI